MKKIIFFMCAFGLYAQLPTEQSILQEAKRQNIVTVEQALNALKQNGISESQARKLAREKGVSFDDFLFSNFKASKKSDTDNLSSDPDTSVLTQNFQTSQKIQNLQEEKPEPFSKVPSFYFGYNIFENNPYLEKEYLLGNIDDSYLISPGDALRIIVFGNNSLELEAVVDRNGNINIPNYGVFFAAGNDFKTFRKRLSIYLGKFFSGLLTTPQNTFLDVSLTQLKPTKIVVVGQVNAPGPQILSTQANTLAALYAAGGVQHSGSLREIRVYRNNKLIKTIDLYDYIVTGRLSGDITLTNNDIIFVPPRISTIFFDGEVKKEGVYELKSGETIFDLVRFSGGLPANATINRMNIMRTGFSSDDLGSNDKNLLTIDYAELQSSNKDFELLDGDQVEVFPIIDRVRNSVKIEGNVFSPGFYSLTKYKDLKSLIEVAASGIKEDTFLEKVDIKGVLLPTGEETFASYNLSEVLSGALYVPLQDRDAVFVYSLEKVQGKQYVYISGYGINTKTEGSVSENEAIFESSSNKEIKEAYAALKKPITSFSKSETSSRNLNIKPSSSKQPLPNSKNQRSDFDELMSYQSRETTRKTANYFESEIDSLSTQIKKSIAVEWRQNLSLYDLIFENTNYSNKDFRKNLFEKRVDVKSYDLQSRKYVTKAIDFTNENVLRNTMLAPHDRVVLYNKNVLEFQGENIVIGGFVNNPGNYTLEQNMYLEDAVLLAGGFSDFADQRVAYVNREERDPKTKIISTKYTLDIDLDYLNGNKVKPKHGFMLKARDVISIRKDNTYQAQQIILIRGEVNYPSIVVAKSKQVSLSYLLDEVGGLTEEALLESSYVMRNDMVLSVNLKKVNKNVPLFQNGDELVIAKSYGSITTEGALENPSVFNWKKGKRAKYYLNNSGGKLRNTGGKAFLIQGNGNTQKIGLFSNPLVYPNSKVVVNYKTKKVREDGKLLNDASSVLGTITGALTTILLLQRL